MNTGSGSQFTSMEHSKTATRLLYIQKHSVSKSVFTHAPNAHVIENLTSGFENTCFLCRNSGAAV